MADSRPIISLLPSLLARKGAARPAMRGQLAPAAGTAATAQLEDLGWNDLGHDYPAPAPAGSRRKAFTLRLDAARHAKLRLACTARNRSAQQLVTEAIDKLLHDLFQVADFAAQAARADR